MSDTPTKSNFQMFHIAGEVIVAICLVFVMMRQNSKLSSRIHELEKQMESMGKVLELHHETLGNMSNKPQTRSRPQLQAKQPPQPPPKNTYVIPSNNEDEDYDDDDLDEDLASELRDMRSGVGPMINEIFSGMLYPAQQPPHQAKTTVEEVEESDGGDATVDDSEEVQFVSANDLKSTPATKDTKRKPSKTKKS